MDRRTQIERLIIGTLLNSTGNEEYFLSCRSCITADMFSDDRNARLYSLIRDMNINGIRSTTPYDVADHCRKGGVDISDILSYMVEISIDSHFEMKKYEYNRDVYHCDASRTPRYTRVRFEDYINRFMQLVFSNARSEELQRSA